MEIIKQKNVDGSKFCSAPFSVGCSIDLNFFLEIFFSTHYLLLNGQEINNRKSGWGLLCELGIYMQKTGNIS